MEFTYVNLLLVLALAWTGGALANRAGFPAIVGELVAGIVFGPPLLGILEPQVGIQVLAEVGVFLMMLYIGMEINVKEMRRSGLAAVLAAAGGFAGAFGLVYLAVLNFGGNNPAAIVAGAAAGVTSLAVGSRLLVDLRLMNTRIATVLTSGALICDTVALVIFTAVMNAAGSDLGDTAEIAIMASKIVGFFAVSWLVGVLVLPRLAAAVQRLGFDDRTGHFTIILIVALCYAELAELAGLHSILGAFLAGIFLGERFLGFRQSHELRELVHDLSMGFLAPIFFVQAGFDVDFGVFQAAPEMLATIITAALLGKALGTMFFYVLGQRGWREGLALGVGMNGRGALDLVIAQLAKDAGLISKDIFSALVFLALISTVVVPVALKASIEWLRRRGQLVEAETRSGAIIVGAGPTAIEMGKFLAENQPVMMIDSNTEHCERAIDAGLGAINGNALDESVLQEAGAGHVRTLVTLTENPQINVYASQLAREVFMIPDIFAYVSGADLKQASRLVESLEIPVFNLGAYELREWDRWLRRGNATPSRIVADATSSLDDMVEESYVHGPYQPLAVHNRYGLSPAFGVMSVKDGDVVYGLALPEDERQRMADDVDRLLDTAEIIDYDQGGAAEDCFHHVAGPLADRIGGIDARELTRLLLEREKMDSTVVAHGVALPHVLVDGENVFELVVVRSRTGVDMPSEGDDNEDHLAHALFISVGTRDMRSRHLKTLSAVAQIVKDESFEQRWMDAPDIDSLRGILRGARRKRYHDTRF